MSTPTMIPPDTEVEQILQDVDQSAALGEIQAELAEAKAEEFPTGRVAAIVGLTVTSAAVMSGGVFLGATPRVYAILAGIAGVAIGLRASMTRRPGAMYAIIIGGIFLTGVILVIPKGFENVTQLGSRIRFAIRAGDVLRPPVEFLPGWIAILSWLMSALGFAAAWVALELRKPAIGLLVPLPVVAISAISVPESQQLASGLVCLVLFAIALGLLSGTQHRGADDQQASLAYEVRRALRALPLIGAVTVALIFLSKSGFLFPPPLYDPAQEAKKPKTIPLSEVEDRVLFSVQAEFTGPWKMGTLDVYDGQDWRLPPFAQSQLKSVPKSGIVDPSLEQAVEATFTVEGLTGAVLPTLPNTAGVASVGPKLSYDYRPGTIRLTQGTIERGVQYKVTAAGVPQIEKLRNANPQLPDGFERYLEVPKPAPPAVEGLLRSAPQENLWDKLDHARQFLLKTVAAAGAGNPVSVTPQRVQEMLAGTKEGTPFEIVAAQAMIARWAGVPSRIGYGFDGGEEAPGGKLEVRPKHGAVFLEVFFTGFGWLPVIGDPLQAKESFSDSPTQFNPQVLASDDVSVRIFIPFFVEPSGELFKEIRSIILTVLPIVGGLFLIYYLWPLPYKMYRRARRRSWAADQGSEARIAVAYAEWRDACIDYGYKHETDTPLMFLDRVIPDDEHAELAWLVTRALWGDLNVDVNPDLAHTAEELSSSLRRRLGQAHAVTLRFVAALSRLSLRHPYAPGLDAHHQKLQEKRIKRLEEKVAAAV